MQREPQVSSSFDDDDSSQGSTSTSSPDGSPMFRPRLWSEDSFLPVPPPISAIPSTYAADENLSSYFNALAAVAVSPDVPPSPPHSPSSLVSESAPFPANNAYQKVRISEGEKDHVDPEADLNRKVRVSTPNGSTFDTVVCPFHDTVHYDPDVELEEYSAEQLSQSDIVFSKEFALLSVTCRVLSMALDPTVPLLDRFKFLCLVSFYLDEHFTKRLGHIPKLDPRDLESATINLRKQVRPSTKYEEELTAAIRTTVEMQHTCLTQQLLPTLLHHGVEVVKGDRLTEEESKRMTEHFSENLLPEITPFTLDPTHPFPLLQSHEIYVYVNLYNPGQKCKKRMLFRVPSSERLIPLDDTRLRFVTAEDVCLANIHLLCQSMTVISSHVFRITRNTKISIDDQQFGDSNLLDFVIEEVHRRRQAPATRLEVLDTAPEKMVLFLMGKLHLEKSDVYAVHSPILDLTTCMSLAFVELPWLRQTMRDPVVPPAFKGLTDRLRTDPGAIFAVIRKKDVLVEYPKENFENSAILYLHAAARDPAVRSIKTVIYRGGSSSPIIAALVRAAKNGKEVSVVVELKASLDEVQNSDYARALQLAGCNVTYGVMGLKVHSKVMLVTRQEYDGNLLQYCNISTGNFNPKTAKLYTDLSLFTCRKEICRDVQDVFNSLTGYSWKTDFNTLLVAPVNMLERFIGLIRTEAENAKAGKPARIVAQMNGLTDKMITRELYEASRAGVKIDLVIRGPCRLRPGIKDMSDNIRVYSWVGQLLQHQRIFYFAAGGEGKFLIGSADWRTRNLTSRVEVVVPVEDRGIRKRLAKMFDIIDDRKWIWRMSPDGRYYKGIPREAPSVAKAIAPTREGKKGGKKKRQEKRVEEKVREDTEMEQRGENNGRSSPHQVLLDAMFAQAKKTRSQTMLDVAELEKLPASSSGSTDEKPRKRTHKAKLQVDVKGNKKQVDKIAVGAVPMRFRDGVEEIENLQVLMVSRGGNDVWAMPKGGILETETEEQATFRIAREKAGVVRAEKVANLGWILVSKKTKQIAVQTFVLRASELGTFAANSGERRRRWVGINEAIGQLKREKHDFSLQALQLALQACRRIYGEPIKKSVGSYSEGDPVDSGDSRVEDAVAKELGTSAAKNADQDEGTGKMMANGRLPNGTAV